MYLISTLTTNVVGKFGTHLQRYNSNHYLICVCSNSSVSSQEEDFKMIKILRIYDKTTTFKTISIQCNSVHNMDPVESYQTAWAVWVKSQFLLYFNGKHISNLQIAVSWFIEKYRVVVAGSTENNFISGKIIQEIVFFFEVSVPLLKATVGR